MSSKLAGILASAMFLIVGTNIFWRSGTFDFDSMLYALKLGILSAMVAGFLGYLIGNIFQSSKQKKQKDKAANKSQKNKKNLLIDDILLEDMEQLDKEFE